MFPNKSGEMTARLADIARRTPRTRNFVNNAKALLDMKVIHINNSLSSTWYTKSTDTGLLMNYHALAPMKYKMKYKSVIFTGSSARVVLTNTFTRVFKRPEVFF